MKVRFQTMLENLDCGHAMKVFDCCTTVSVVVVCEQTVCFLLCDRNFNFPLFCGITIVVNRPNGTSFSIHRVSTYLVVVTKRVRRILFFDPS
jgi:hypothetical protein